MTNEEAIAEFRTVGGTAFPAELAMPEGGAITSPGMTLRDWFAAQALAGLLAEPQPDDGEPGLGLGREYAAAAAQAAYRFADAMLAARTPAAQSVGRDAT